MGSTGAATGKAAAADGAGGLDLYPVYVPAYIFSWWHGGAKVRPRWGKRFLDGQLLLLVVLVPPSG
jgi:hypothetical protein